MHPDIVESRDAVEALLGAIRHEEQSLRRLEEEWRGRMRDQASRGALFRNVTSDPFADLDDTLMATGAYWEAYDEGPRIEQLERTIEELRRAIDKPRAYPNVDPNRRRMIRARDGHRWTSGTVSRFRVRGLNQDRFPVAIKEVGLLVALV